MDFTKSNHITIKNIIEELIPEYPSIKNENFIDEISLKEELYQLRYTEFEQKPKEQGTLLKTQKMVQRIFSPHTPYTSGLIFHQMGTGKGCTASAVIENFKNEFTPSGEPRKPALVIVKSPALIDAFHNEITNVCTSEIYDPQFTPKEILKGEEKMSHETMIRRRNENVRKTYEIITKTTLFNKNLTDDEIKKKYSNRIIFIDEAHTFRIQPSKGKSKKKDKHENINEDEAEDEDELKTIAEEKLQGDETVDKETYDKMHHFLHLLEGEGCRIFLMTGTPIWDKTYEIASLMNLILPLDQQLPLGETFMNKYFDRNTGDLLPNAYKELKDIFKGKVSYLRQITNATKITVGVVKPWLNHIKVYPDVMSKFQSDWNKRLYVPGSTEAFYIRERDIANIVYPKKADAKDVEIAKKKNITIKEGEFIGDVFTGNFKKLVGITDKNKVGKFPDTLVTQLVGSITNPSIETLRNYSTKFASVIEDILNNPTQRFFIYIDGVTGGGGVVAFSMILQLFGFEQISALTDTELEKKFNNITPLNKGKKFTLITGSGYGISEDNLLTEFIKLDSQSKNRYGDYNRIIIGSQKISLGFSLKNIRQVDIIMPYFHMSAISQAEDRGFRFGSHDDLKPEERILVIKHHVAVYPGTKEVTFEQNNLIKKISVSEEKTTDIHIYQIAEIKDYSNAGIYRLLKEAAIDCKLNYKRSVLKSDIDYSRECDYRKCNYQCYGSKNENNEINFENLDFSTYRLFYNKNDILSIIIKIIKLFKNYYSLSFEQIMNLIDINENEKQINESVVLEALSQIIILGYPIFDRLNIKCYLKESGNIYFLDNIISTSNPDYNRLIYIKKPFIDILETSIETYINNLVYKTDREGALKFCETGDLSVLENVSYNTIVDLVEISYILKLDSKLNQKQITRLNILLDKYKSFINTLTIAPKPAMNKYLQSLGISGNKIILHTLLHNKGKNKVDFNTRILNQTKTGWITIIHDQKFINFLNKYIKPTEISIDPKLIEEYKIYGLYKVKGKFSVNIKKDQDQDEETDQQKKGKRKKSGQVCTTLSLSDLIDIVRINLKILPAPLEIYSLDVAKKYIKGTNKGNEFDIDKETDLHKLSSIVRLINMSKEDLCLYIEETMKKLNLVISK